MSECIGDPGDARPCRGKETEGRSASGATVSTRCERHWDAYWPRMEKLQRDIDRRYPKHAPADFDPSYAGESWDEDY